MRYRGLICAVALATALLATPAAAQLVDFGKYPNLKGQWVRPPGSPNNWLRLAGQPPLTPEYQKIWQDIQADLKAGGPGNWPSTFCIPAGRGRRRQVRRARGRDAFPQAAAQLRYLGCAVPQRRGGHHQGADPSRQSRPQHAA